MNSLWARRYTPARGWYWVRERGPCDDDSVMAQWLAIYQTDEPSVQFKLAKRKPRD